MRFTRCHVEMITCGPDGAWYVHKWEKSVERWICYPPPKKNKKKNTTKCVLGSLSHNAENVGSTYRTRDYGGLYHRLAESNWRTIGVNKMKRRSVLFRRYAHFIIRRLWCIKHLRSVWHFKHFESSVLPRPEHRSKPTSKPKWLWNFHKLVVTIFYTQPHSLEPDKFNIKIFILSFRSVQG